MNYMCRREKRICSRRKSSSKRSVYGPKTIFVLFVVHNCIVCAYVYVFVCLYTWAALLQRLILTDYFFFVSVDTLTRQKTHKHTCTALIRCMKRTISKSKGLHCKNYNDDDNNEIHIHIEWIALTVDVSFPIKPCVTKWISDYYQWATCMRISAISTISTTVLNNTTRE